MDVFERIIAFPILRPPPLFSIDKNFSAAVVSDVPGSRLLFTPHIYTKTCLDTCLAKCEYSSGLAHKRELEFLTQTGGDVKMMRFMSHDVKLGCHIPRGEYSSESSKPPEFQRNESPLNSNQLDHICFLLTR